MATTLFGSVFKFKSRKKSKKKPQHKTLLTSSNKSRTQSNTGRELVHGPYKKYYEDYNTNIIPAISLIRTNIIENNAFNNFLLSILNSKLQKALKTIKSSTLDQTIIKEEDRYKLVVGATQFINDYFDYQEYILSITTMIEFLYSLLGKPQISASSSKYEDAFILTTNVNIISVLIPILEANQNELITLLHTNFSSRTSTYFDKKKVSNEFRNLRSRTKVAIEIPKQDDLGAGKIYTKYKKQKRVLAQTKRALMHKKRYNIRIKK